MSAPRPAKADRPPRGSRKVAEPTFRASAPTLTTYVVRYPACRLDGLRQPQSPFRAFVRGLSPPWGGETLGAARRCFSRETKLWWCRRDRLLPPLGEGWDGGPRARPQPETAGQTKCMPLAIAHQSLSRRTRKRPQFGPNRCRAKNSAAWLEGVFGATEVLRPFREVDKWIRRRLRCYALKQ